MSLSRLQFVAVGCFGLYTLTAFRVGEAFPFARFHMFDHFMVRASRLVAIPADGRPHEISEFVNWDCKPVEHVDRSCFQSYPEGDARIYKELESSRAESSAPRESLKIARREISTPDSDGPAVIRYCALLACTAQAK